MTDPTTLFRYALGTVVTWTGGPPVASDLIVQRRHTERDILGPVVAYLLGSCAHPETPLHWVCEADLSRILSQEKSRRQ